jgi:hypothetical protein
LGVGLEKYLMCIFRIFVQNYRWKFKVLFVFRLGSSLITALKNYIGRSGAVSEQHPLYMVGLVMVLYRQWWASYFDKVTELLYFRYW